MTTRETLGIKNKNPWNVKAPMNAARWRGQQNSDKHNHAIFDDPAWSCRAAIKILRTYQRLRRLTLRETFEHYAPSSDPNANNEPNAYARFVAGRMGIDADEPLGLFTDEDQIADEPRLRAMLKAMAEFENYAGYDPGDDVITEGINLYREVKV